MADDEPLTDLTAAWTVDGVRYDVDFYDIDGVEWRDITKATNALQSQVMAQALYATEFDAVGAFIWIVRRRSEPDLKYEDVLKTITYRSLRRVDDGEGNPSPPA